MAGPDGYLTIDELRRANPRQNGEGVFEYSQRIGQMLAQQNRQRGSATPNIFDPAAPRGQDESNVMSFLRQNVGGAISRAFDITPAARYMGDLQKDTAQAGQQAWNYLWDTPRQQQEAVAKAKAVPAAAAFAPSQQGQPLTSYKDPRWADFEAQAEQKYGLPAGMLATIRLKGERSNSNQVSSAGARGVYQFIPATRDAVLKKYGVDAYGSPAQQAMATAALLKENMQRTGSAAGAIQQYHGGTDPRNYGPENAAYMARTMGDQAGFVNPFDPSYFNQAAAEIDKAGAAAKRPTTFAFTPEAEPELPDAQKFVPAPTDFSKVDAAVEKLRPEEMQESVKLQMRRQAYFRGIGEALMALPESAGLGKVLAAVGGGALAGSSIGDDKVRAEMEKFDQKMAQYNMAVLRNESDQAEVRHREAAQSADFLYRSAVAKYEQQYKTWARFNTPSMDAQGNIITQTKDPKTGVVTMQRIPNAAAIDAATAEKKADIFLRAGGEQNAGGRLEATARNGLIGNMIAVQASQAMSSPDTAQAMVSYPAMLATQIIDGGGLESLMQSAWSTADGKSQGTWQQGLANLQRNAETAAMAAIGQSGAVGAADLVGQENLAKVKQSPAYQEAYRRSLIQQVQMLALDPNRPAFRKKLFDIGGVYTAGAAGMAQADRRVSTRTDAKGRTLTSTTTDYGN